MLQLTAILTTLLILIPITNQTLIVENIDGTLGYTQIKLGETDIVLNYDTLLHIINLPEIENIINQIEQNVLIMKLSTDKTIILENEIKKLKSKLKTIIPHRHRRAPFNFIGTIQKWLYGTMDNQDREEISGHLNTIDINNHNIIGNTNQQVKINKNFNETFVQIKNIIEGDRKILQEKINDINNFNNRLFSDIQYIDYTLKIKILLDSIQSIQDNIASSRSGILHSNILTIEEIEEYQIDLIKLKNIKLATLVDNNSNIIFIIMIPKETIKLDLLLITAITNNKNQELILQTEKIIKFKNTTYIYNENRDIKNQVTLNNCLTKKNCMKKFNNESEIIEIDQGIVLAKNQKYANLTSNCDQRNIVLSGNYLLNFHNCTIKINQYTMYNNEKEFRQRFIITNDFKDLNDLDSKISFEEIILKQEKNTEEIKEAKFNKALVYTGISISTVMIIVVITIVIILYLYIKNKTEKIKIENVIKPVENPPQIIHNEKIETIKKKYNIHD